MVLYLSRGLLTYDLKKKMKPDKPFDLMMPLTSVDKTEYNII